MQQAAYSSNSLDFFLASAKTDEECDDLGLGGGSGGGTLETALKWCLSVSIVC